MPTGIEVQQQKLLHRGREMQDNKTMYDYKVIESKFYADTFLGALTFDNKLVF